VTCHTHPCRPCEVTYILHYLPQGDESSPRGSWGICAPTLPEVLTGGAVVGAETEGKDEGIVDHVSEQEADSIAIDLVVNKTRRSLMRREYERVWNKPHRSRVFASVNPDTPPDVSVNVDKAEVGSVDNDETESDEVGEDEDPNEDVQVKRDDDSSYLPGTSLGDNDDDEDDAMGGNNNNSDDMGEYESVEDVIVAEDEVGVDETNTKKQQQHHETWVNNLLNYSHSRNPPCAPARTHG
jgi:hypothetical protein